MYGLSLNKGNPSPRLGIDESQAEEKISLTRARTQDPGSSSLDALPTKASKTSHSVAPDSKKQGSGFVASTQ